VPTLAFDDDAGSVGGSTGVNQFHASCTADGDVIELGPVVSTRMAGSPEAMAQESAFLQVLAGRCSVRLDAEGRLVLDGGSSSLLLRPGELPRLM
jgi:heat shock protein HslJ